jgi:Ca2+/Na+ antiporter
MIKNFIKKNIISIVAIAIVAAIVFIKFALPLLTVLALFILCVGGLYFFKRKNVQVQIGGNNSKQVQYTNDKNTVHVQEAGDNSEQVQIYKD